MKTNILLCLILILGYSQLATSQNPARTNIWHFGAFSGIDFNTSPPIAITDGKLSTVEGCATLCDTAGQLMIYSDGSTIWNRNHQIIPNAINLGGHISTSQSAIIVPKPNSSDSIYVFSVYHSGLYEGLRYAIVDMSLNNGLGGLVSSQNIILTPSTEKVTAIQHCNKEDFWIVAHEHNSTNFYVWELTSNGLSTTPIITSIGALHNQPIGYIKASPNGKKLAVTTGYLNSTIEVFDFDNVTGQISNPIVISNVDNPYGVEFSPNSQLLYSTGFITPDIYVYQINMALPTSAQIAASTIVVGHVAQTPLGALQNAPDGKMYIAKSSSPFLSVIENPNLLGPNCNFVEDEFFLGGELSQLGLPNMIPAFLKQPTAVSIADSIDYCNKSGYLIATINEQPDSVLYEWFKNNTLISGTNNDSLLVNTEGLFQLKVTIFSDCNTATTFYDSLDVVFPLDTTYLFDTTCDTSQAGVFTQILTNQYDCDSTVITSVQLLPTDTMFILQSTCDATQAGIFIDTLTNFYGCDSFIITTVELLTDTTFFNNLTCDSSQIGTFTTILTNQYGCDSTVISTVTFNQIDTLFTNQMICQGDTIDILGQQISEGGLYCMTYTTSLGCDSTACIELNIDFHSIPIELFAEDVSCKGEATGTAMISTSHPLPIHILWNTGSNNSILNNLSANWYYLTVTDSEGCFVTDSIEVQEPNEELTANLILKDISCYGFNDGFIKVNGTGGTSPYDYSINNDDIFNGVNQINGLSTGSYIVSVRDHNDCIYSETITLDEPLPFEVDLGEDRYINWTEEIAITPSITNGIPPFDYLWFPVLENTICNSCPTLALTNLQETQLYTLQIEDSNGCISEDEVWVHLTKERTVVVATGFTPNNDGINDYLFVQTNDKVEQIISFSVYDRWGEKVFEAQNIVPNIPNLGWDGFFKGKSTNNGIYGWILEVEFIDGVKSIYKGNSTLIR